MRNFFSIRNPVDRLYGLIARYPQHAQYVSDLWQVVEPYLDTRRPQAAAAQFHDTFWEMYLAAALLSARLPLVRRTSRRMSSGGPDIQIGHVEAWVEAVVATGGTGPDRVLPDDASLTTSARFVPDRELILRIREAINQKCQAYRAYRDKDWIREGEAYVIAVNGGMLPLARLDTDIPRAVRVAYGCGELTVTVNVETATVVKEEFPPMLSVSGSKHTFPLGYCSGTISHFSARSYGAPPTR